MKWLPRAVCVVCLATSALSRGDDPSIQEKRAKDLALRITELEGRIANCDLRIKKAERELSAGEKGAAERMQAAKEDKRDYSAKRDSLVQEQKVAASPTPGGDGVVEDKLEIAVPGDKSALLAAYREATGKLDAWESRNLKEIEDGEADIKEKIETARIAFSKAKESKITEIEDLLKKLSEEMQAANDALATKASHGSRTIASARAAVAAGKVQKQKYNDAIAAVKLRAFEDSDNYRKAQAIVAGLESRKKTLEADKAAHLSKLSAIYAAKLVSMEK